MNIENVSTLKINQLTRSQYEREVAAGNIDVNAFYLTPDEYIDAYLDPVTNINLVGKIVTYCRDSVTESNRRYRLMAHIADQSPAWFENGLWIFEIIKDKADGICHITGTNGISTVTFTSDGNTFSERKFSNPLMITGCEYCTTEYYMGKAVWTALLNLGTHGPGRHEFEYDGISGVTKCIRNSNTPTLFADSETMTKYVFSVQTVALNNGNLFCRVVSGSDNSDTEVFVQVWYTKD